MRTSQRGIDFIKTQEGKVLHAYRDVVGVLTIGYGHTKGVKASDKLTDAQAEDLLKQDLAEVYEPEVTRVMGALPQNVFDGAVDFHFNTGAIRKASWVAKWKAGDTAGVRKNLMMWNKAGGRVLTALTRRRSAEADIILLNIYPGQAKPKPANVNAPPVTMAPTLPLPQALFRLGDNDPEVADFQAQLKSLGFDLEQTGVFGPKTDAVVRQFQRAHPNLIPDGIVGKATRAAIQREVDLNRKVKTSTAGGAVATTASAGTLPVWAMIGVGVAAILVLGFVLWQYRDEIEAKFNRGAQK